jgi:excisionase family DNA binding protein
VRDETLTVEEAASYLRVDPVTIMRELKRGRLLGTKVGKAWRISKEVIADYVRGGDPTLGMVQASSRFHNGDIDGGLRLLLRHLVAVMTDPRFPADCRSDLLQRLAILSEADEEASAKRAREAAFKETDPQWMQERAGDVSRSLVGISGMWNQMVVKAMADAIEQKARARRKRSS